MRQFNKYKKVVLIAGLLGFTAGLSACAVETIPYPKLSTAKNLKNRILSREEQQEVIRDLSAEKAQHETSAITAIEKKP